MDVGRLCKEGMLCQIAWQAAGQLGGACKQSYLRHISDKSVSWGPSAPLRNTVFSNRVGSEWSR